MSPTWNTPALYVTILTNILAVGAFISTAFFHMPFDRAAIAPLVPTAAIAPLVPTVAALVAGVVTFIYVHGFHKIQVAAHLAAKGAK